MDDVKNFDREGGVVCSVARAIWGLTDSNSFTDDVYLTQKNRERGKKRETRELDDSS